MLISICLSEFQFYKQQLCAALLGNTKRKKADIEQYQTNIDYITMKFVRYVCNSQISKAFELAAAYLKIRKAKEKANNKLQRTNTLDETRVMKA